MSGMNRTLLTQFLIEKVGTKENDLAIKLLNQLSEDEIKAEINEAIASLGVSGPQDMGKLMGHLSAKLSGKADGKLIATLVKAALS
jgi:uncharacterized protein YqeY